MCKIEDNNIVLEKLIYNINELRNMLNELCITTDNDENKEDVLKVSEYLDELIVEYMKQIDTKGEYINLL